MSEKKRKTLSLSLSHPAPTLFPRLRPTPSLALSSPRRPRRTDLRPTPPPSFFFPASASSATSTTTVDALPPPSTPAPPPSRSPASPPPAFSSLVHSRRPTSLSPPNPSTDFLSILQPFRLPSRQKSAAALPLRRNLSHRHLRPQPLPAVLHLREPPPPVHSPLPPAALHHLRQPSIPPSSRTLQSSCSVYTSEECKNGCSR